MTKREIERALKGVKPDELREEIAKDEKINIRVTNSDKEHMKRVAKYMGVTLTEYLLSLHRLAASRLNVD